MDDRTLGQLWLAAAVVFVVFLVVILPAEAARTLEATGTSETPDTSWMTTPADLTRLAGEYGPDGRAHYVRSRFTFDLVWPAVYGTFLQLGLLVLRRRGALGWSPRPLVALPSAAVVADLVENVTASLVMVRYPEPAPAALAMAPLATTTKWTLLTGSFVLLAVGGVGWTLRRVRGR